MKSKDITNKITEWTDPMDMINRGRRGAEMGGGPERGGFGGYTGGPSPFGGGGGISRSAAKKEFGREQARTSQMSPAEKQADKEVRSGQYTPSPAPKKGEAPPAKREEPALSTQQRNYKELDRPAVQRKAEADKTAKDAATKDRSSQPHYTIDPKTGKPIPANVQAQLQQKLQGKGFKDPEPGSISGFKPRSDKGPAKAEPKVEPKAEPKAEPAAQAPVTQRTLSGQEIRPGLKFNTTSGKWEKDPNYSGPTLPSARNTPIKQEKTDKKSAAASVGLHAALLAALANMTPDEKKSAAEKSTSAQQGDATKPMTVSLVDPGSEKAADAPATAQPSTSTAITQPSADAGGEKSLPPVVVTAEPNKPTPQKKQPEKVEDPTRKAEQPKADTVVATDQPSSWETETSKDEEKAEADKADDKESAKITQAVPEPEEDKKDEEDVLEKLRKLLGLDKNAEQQAKTEPAKEPAKEPEAKKDEPKPEPEKVAQDGPGKADAEKGDAGKRGDEKEAFPKFKRDEKTEKPADTEKKGDDEITRKTDSAVDKGPAATGTDNAINWAPPPPERKYEPDERANRDRANLIRRQQQRDAELQDRKRMTPDVNESLNHILSLSNITKKEIAESTMNLDMRQMIALLDEATKMADIKGKKHTGKYGKEFDTDEEGEAKEKKAEPAAKQGRGRPKKDSTVDAGKWKGSDDAAKHVIGGKAPKGKSNLPSKKHTLKDWVEHTEQSIQEGAKVDRMVGHIAKSERGLGKSKKDAENIAWATANKRGYLDNKNKKKVKEESHTVNKKPVSKGEYDATMKAAGKSPSPPEKVKEELKGGQKNLDVAEPKGKLDSKDFAQLRAKKDMKKKVKEGINFAEMMKETQMGIEEMLEGLQQEIAEFKATGHMGDNLRDALDIHRYKGKDKLMGEAPMMSQAVVEEPLEENPFTYAARQAKASGDDSFKLDGKTFPVQESEEVEESGLQAYLGNKKYGKEGMDALRKAGREGASKEKMAKIRARHDKMDEDGPGAARVYGDNEKSDFDVVDTMKKFANKGIDKWNDYEQGKKDRWDAAYGGNAGYTPGTLPRFDTKDDNYPDEFKRGIKSVSTTPSTKREPEPSIFDREKPYRDKSGKMVTPPKGLSISEPLYPNAVDINKPRKSMKESLDFSLWDTQLEKMLNESLTISTTQGDNGGDDSVSITASGEKAAEIMALLRNAGMDSMSGPATTEPEVEIEPEQMLSAYGVPMLGDSEESHSGHDDIVSLMQKLTGLGSDEEGDSEDMEIDVIEPDHEEHDSEDYEEEDNEDEGEEEDQAEEDSDEEDSSDEEEEKVDEAYGQADEGNAFTEKLKQTQKGDEFELDGKKYKDTSSLEEGEGMCQECGMNEAECGHDRMDEADSPFQNENLESARPIEEELANGADDTTMQDIKFLIKTLAGGLNKEKRDQTTLPHTAVKVTESKEMLNEWKKLSGIK